MKAEMRLEGARDLERALAELPRSTSKAVARRIMKKELKPVKDAAEAFWPGANEAFQISSRISRSQSGDSEAVRGPSIENMFVGSFEPHAHLLEFGTGPRYTEKGAYRGSVSPEPMLQPAWDAHKRQVLTGLGERMWEEIKKTVERRAQRSK